MLLLLACHAPDKPDDTGGVDTATDPEVTFTEGDCLDDLPRATCGTVTVPERRGSGSERTVTLPVAVLPARSGAPNDPFVLFNGGPGSSALDLAALFDRGGLMSAIVEDHDVVLYSERGTRGATPELDCPELADVDALFTEPADVRLAATLVAYQACHDRLVAEGVDLAAFTNDTRAADVPDVLHALGYDAWHLWGVSGGAVLVQRVLRDHPEGTLTAHLDSGGFPTAHMGDIPLDVVANVSDRFARLVDVCAADPVCAADHPTLEADLWDLVATLEATPATRTITHPTTGVTADVALDGDLALQVLANAFAYVGYIPKAIEDARGGDFTLIDTLLPYAFAVDTGATFADGLYASVLCTDVGAVTVDDVTVDGVPAPVVSALLPTVENLLATCAIWDVPAVPPEGAVESDVPALFLEGLFDANRRPEEGRGAAEGYTTATVAEFPDRGHVVLDACAVDLITQVIATPDVAPDTSCIPTGVTWQ